MTFQALSDLIIINPSFKKLSILKPQLSKVITCVFPFFLKRITNLFSWQKTVIAIQLKMKLFPVKKISTMQDFRVLEYHLFFSYYS